VRFLDSACGDDAQLRAEVLDLLANHAEGADPLDAPPSWSAVPVVPAQLGPYRVLDLIGQGGMGVVYRAQALDGGDSAPFVALKVLRSGIVTTQLERRFRREIEVLRRFDHPGIARLLDAGTAEGSPYLAMEFVEGVTLARWRAEADPPVADRLRLLADLCDAVHYAHGNGVIHRDLKPENILVTAEGRPKVLDFGIARFTDNEASAQTFATQTWQLLGTIRYMSPEQATGGPGAIDARTDVYALGVIAYELLTGGLPYDLNRLSTPRALLEITTVQPRRLDGQDGAVELMVHHALEKIPGWRYQTAAAMAADLRRHLAGRPISLRRPGVIPRARQALRARPRLRRLVLGLSIAAAAIVATLLLSPSLRPQPPETWSRLYAQLEEADQLRHSGAPTRENYLAAAALFQRARVDLAGLPVEPYSPDLNRYIKWRLGELHFFIGDLEHDAVMLEQARGFWHDASAIPWKPGTAMGIDPSTVVRAKVLRLARHHPSAGVGFALAGLASLRSPATNWRAASLASWAAFTFYRDELPNYHDDSSDVNDRDADRVFTLLNLGSDLTALGATVDSVEVVDRGLVRLRAAALDGGLRSLSNRAMLHQALGAGFLRRAEIGLGVLPTAAEADLDSARSYLDRAREARDLSDGRGYWALNRWRGRAYEVSALVVRDRVQQHDLLVRAEEELRDSLEPLREGVDDFERALTRADLAGVEAQVAAFAADREGFAPAESLLLQAEVVLTPARFPIQFAELMLQRGRVARLRWTVTAEAVDSVAAVAALAHARGPVPQGEYPALHRRIADEERRLVGARP
jgi:serine/threonine protein kinase